jgi:hypothetical protein
VFDELTRENIEGRVVRRVGRPKWRDASVKVIEADGRRAILKDIGGRGWWFRVLFGRRLLARERRVLQRLDDVSGVPRAWRMLDRDGLLMEYIEGTYLSKKKVRSGELEIPPDLYGRCLGLVAELHARGVFHLDLRNRKNFVFTADLEPHIVDFASAVCVPRRLPLRGPVTRLLGWVDRVGVLKMKRLLSPERLTEPERRDLRRFERLRSVLLPHTLVTRRIRRFLRRRRRAKERRAAAPP